MPFVVVATQTNPRKMDCCRAATNVLPRRNLALVRNLIDPPIRHRLKKSNLEEAIHALGKFFNFDDKNF